VDTPILAQLEQTPFKAAPISSRECPPTGAHFPLWHPRRCASSAMRTAVDAAIAGGVSWDVSR
jgi:hypothetical protein